ncbi:MAG: mannose-1-phosphate guanylyltransferase [Planctomycetota bacterium]
MPTETNDRARHRHAVIMAGGAGTRLWPLSRQSQPKQLIPFIQPDPAAPAKSLLEVAAGRLEGVVAPERRYIGASEKHRAEIKAALPAFTDDRILGEPALRDTMNAVGLAAAVFDKLDHNAVFAVLTADHLIEPQDTFAACMDAAFKLVEDDPSRLVTFSIKPDHPATGYGYLKHGAAIDNGTPDTPPCMAVDEFVEKPPLNLATKYVESGDYGWNSGMFVFSAQTVLRLLAKLHPPTHAGLRDIQNAWGTPHQKDVLDSVYPELHKTSVDYGLMEPASRDPSASICAVSMDVRWLDVGSWPSYAETLTPDAAGNRTSGAGAVVAHDCKNVLTVGAEPGHTVALLGCEDLIVVHTKEATLVMPRAKAQDLKLLHSGVEDGLK